MTIQVSIPAYGKSKAALAQALNSNTPGHIFHDPSIFPEKYYGAHFGLHIIKVGDSFPVVMDPDKRQRFALFTRKLDGTFKVS